VIDPLHSIYIELDWLDNTLRREVAEPQPELPLPQPIIPDGDGLSRPPWNCLARSATTRWM
jgi:hypothetical protein